MIGLLTWTTPCRIVRAQFLSLREKEYVEAARTIGMTDFDVARKHILSSTSLFSPSEAVWASVAG